VTKDSATDRLWPDDGHGGSGEVCCSGCGKWCGGAQSWSRLELFCGICRHLTVAGGAEPNDTGSVRLTLKMS
jgi:hypothetical protein